MMSLRFIDHIVLSFHSDSSEQHITVLEKKNNLLCFKKLEAQSDNVRDNVRVYHLC